MKQTIITKIFNFILVSLGFTSVVSCERPPFVCMYGMMTMDFEVSGKVVNQESEPIAGIKVSCHSNTEPGYASVFTAEDGSFSIAGSIGPSLELKDVDGPENGGEFADKIEEIQVHQIGKGDGKWYMGKYEAKDVVIVMEGKK